MNFVHFRFLFISVLVFNFCEGIELKCEYGSLGSLGTACYLDQKITAGTEEDGYTFTEISDEQREKVNVLYFRTSDVAFAPKEALEAFSNLNTIGIRNREFKTLSFDFLTNLLKLVKPKTKKLYFIGSGLERIDPKVIPIFQEMEQVHLFNNICSGKAFKTKEDFAGIDSALKKCTDNFEAFCKENENDKDC